MTARPSAETIESLHLILKKVQQSSDTAQDEASLADLKRILLNRIAELEVTMVLEPADAEVAKVSDPSALVPPSVVEGDRVEESSTPTEPAKLD